MTLIENNACTIELNILALINTIKWVDYTIIFKILIDILERRKIQDKAGLFVCFVCFNK